MVARGSSQTRVTWCPRACPASTRIWINPEKEPPLGGWVWLRGGADDDAVAAAIERAVGAKWAGHRVGNVDFIRPDRSMSQIGG